MPLEFDFDQDRLDELRRQAPRRRTRSNRQSNTIVNALKAELEIRNTGIAPFVPKNNTEAEIKKAEDKTEVYNAAIEVLFSVDIVQDEFASSVHLTAKVFATIQKVHGRNKFGFRGTDFRDADPHGFQFGVHFFICSCEIAARITARKFVLLFTELDAELNPVFSCDEDNCEAGIFDTYMDLEYHQFHDCVPTPETLPPMNERHCNLGATSWIIKDEYVRLLARTDFGNLGPQDLINVHRKPFHYPPRADVDRVFKHVRGSSDRITYPPSSTLFSLAEFTCSNCDFLSSIVFLAGLPFIKDLVEWPVDLLRLIVLDEYLVQEEWPDIVKNNVILCW